jgi:hypothetical protein
MNPELPAPQFNPEQGMPSREQASEYGQPFQNPERAGERSPEREQNMQNVDRQTAPAMPPALPVVPAPQVVPAPSVAHQAPSDDLPALAGDDDLIEKEWVDKAKKIISETRDDPYKREQEVNRLQADYLRKRYGKELGSAD